MRVFHRHIESAPGGGRLGLACTLACVLLLAGSTRLFAQDVGIFVMKIDSGEERQVVQVDGFANHASPRWSHDGKRLVFQASDAQGDNQKIFVVNLDGSDLRQISDHGAPDWSPDDKQLAFHNEDDEVEAGVWVQNLDGKGRERLTGGSWPRWSPDGSRIAFCDDTMLKVLDLASGEEKPVVEEAFAQRPGSFAWSHDGKRLAFFTRRAAGGPRELFIVNADGTSQAVTPRLSRNGRFVGGHVTWSPDDKQLAFTIDSFIHTMVVEGNEAPQRLPGQPDKSRDPDWSPDGKWIAFARRGDPQ